MKFAKNLPKECVRYRLWKKGTESGSFHPTEYNFTCLFSELEIRMGLATSPTSQEGAGHVHSHEERTLSKLLMEKGAGRRPEATYPKVGEPVLCIIL